MIRKPNLHEAETITQTCLEVHRTGGFFAELANEAE